jgi:hypothetical protein
MALGKEGVESSRTINLPASPCHSALCLRPDPGNCQKYMKKLKVYFYKLSTLFDLRRQVTSCSSVFMIRAGMYLPPPTVREHLADILPSSLAIRLRGSIFHSQS